MLKRGFRRVLAGEDVVTLEAVDLAAPPALGDPMLVVVDGGRGQLGAAARALETLDLAPRVHLLGLAKRLEEIYLHGRAEPLLLPRTSPALKLLQRLRDEAHRFAIGYHRHLRGQEFLRSALDDIPGVGLKTRGALLRHFGSVDAVAAASAEALCAVPGVGPATAERILAVLAHPALKAGTHAQGLPHEADADAEASPTTLAAPEAAGDEDDGDDVLAREIDVDAD